MALIEFTQRGGEINIVVTGINVGGQPYWNAEATMLMHTRGILVMLPTSAMVLTGKQALDFSGGVSAEDNFGIGGYDRVMGPNGQAQYWAPTLEDACRILLRHYDHTFVVPGERFPRRAATRDPVDRDVRTLAARWPTGNSTCTRSATSSPPSSTRSARSPSTSGRCMRSVVDADSDPLERWDAWRGAETTVVWDAHVGGIPVCLLGLESRTLARRGYVPADGPASWTSGTLFPQSARKAARAINAASWQPAARRPGQPVRVRRVSGVHAALAARVRRRDRPRGHELRRARSCSWSSRATTAVRSWCSPRSSTR